VENRKGLMPGTRPTKRDSSAFPINGEYRKGKSGKRSTAVRAGLSDKHTMTRDERKHAAHDHATWGPEGFHGSKRNGGEILSSRPRSSTPTRNMGRVHKDNTHR
jgi:hypothetical protein